MSAAQAWAEPFPRLDWHQGPWPFPTLTQRPRKLAEIKHLETGKNQGTPLEKSQLVKMNKKRALERQINVTRETLLDIEHEAIRALGHGGSSQALSADCEEGEKTGAVQEAAPAKQKIKGTGVSKVAAGAKTVAPKTAAPTMAGANRTPAAASQARSTRQPKPASLQSAKDRAAPAIGKTRSQPAAKQVTAMEMELRGVEVCVMMRKREGNAERKL